MISDLMKKYNNETNKFNTNIIDNKLELCVQLSQLCLLNIRDDNMFISPLAIQSIFDSLLLKNDESNKNLNQQIPFHFYNYLILNQSLIKSFDENRNVI